MRHLAELNKNKKYLIRMFYISLTDVAQVNGK